MTETTMHPNVEQAWRGVKAFHDGDIAGMRDLFAPDVVWHMPPSHPLVADIIGRDDLLMFFGRIQQETRGTFEAEVHDIVGNDEHVVALMHVRAERGGKRLDQKVINIYKVRDDGKVTERWLFMEDRAAADDFWAF